MILLILESLDHTGKWIAENKSDQKSFTELNVKSLVGGGGADCM